MSGHSHAKKIRHQKDITDQKRGQLFSKVARLILVAVKEGGPNPETNSKLRMAMEMAKEARMPGENIERAIKKGTGELASEKLEEFLFEAYGPGGIAVIIEGITDNKNRALGEIKQILSQNGGKLVGEGAIQWMFDKKGVMEIDMKKYPDKKKEDLEMAAIEAGADDIYWHEEVGLDVYTKPGDLEKVKKNLEEKGIKADSSSLDWVAKEEIGVEVKNKEAAEKLFEALDESDSVQEVYSNIKP